jgi:orotate phosphoribosyltransferase
MSKKQQVIELSLAKGVIVPEIRFLSTGQYSPYYVELDQLTHDAIGRKVVEDALTERVEEQMRIVWRPESNYTLYGGSGAGRSLAEGVQRRLYDADGRNLPIGYERKKEKTKGPRQGYVGGYEFQAGDVVYCIDDVLGTGKRIDEELSRLPEGVVIGGIFFVFDREELVTKQGNGVEPAAASLARKYDCSVISVSTVDELIDGIPGDSGIKKRLQEQVNFHIPPYDFTRIESYEEPARHIVEELVKLPWEESDNQLDHIVQVVSNATNITYEGILGRVRTNAVAKARQIAMYIVKRCTHHSLPEIGTHFSKHHTTILENSAKVQRVVDGGTFKGRGLTSKT